MRNNHTSSRPPEVRDACSSGPLHSYSSRNELARLTGIRCQDLGAKVCCRVWSNRHVTTPTGDHSVANLFCRFDGTAEAGMMVVEWKLASRVEPGLSLSMKSEACAPPNTRDRQSDPMPRGGDTEEVFSLARYHQQCILGGISTNYRPCRSHRLQHLRLSR